MSLSDWLQGGRLHRHSSSRGEVEELLQLVDRGLADASVTAISSDLRFAAAYGAALGLGTLVLACAGYRARGAGHHALTFAALPVVLGEGAADLAAYLDACRAKRHESQYRRVGGISDGEVGELVESTEELRQQVLAWLEATHPELIPEPATEQGRGDRAEPEE